jgi:hypothetical protein
MDMLNKLTIIFICFILFNKANAQFEKNFYITSDTIVVNDPVIISSKKHDGMFLVSHKDIKQGVSIEKLILENKVYIFNNDLYRFFNRDDFNKSIKYVDCSFIEIYEYNKEFIIRKLNFNITKFIVGVIKIDYYNEQIITIDKGKSHFKVKDQNYFYPIVFPICE